MEVTALRGVLDGALLAMPAHADELRSLDAAIGDGDLGITVSAGSTAAREAMNALEPSADLPALLKTLAKAFSTANPSTFAALVGGGLLAAARAAGDSIGADRTSLDRADAVELADAIASRIAERGKAQLGDKTILDALIPSIETLRNHQGTSAGTSIDALDAMIATAHLQIDATTGLQSAKGRAAWVQERSIGHPDPGATAYLRLLQALRSNWPQL